jgi:transposase
MTKQSRRKFTADFKTKVVLEALKERSTIEELSKKHEIHPTQINWKTHANKPPDPKTNRPPFPISN